jgi:hypothetical protein
MKFSIVNVNFKNRRDKRGKEEDDNNNKLLSKPPQMLSQMRGGVTTFPMLLWKLVFHR